jgi:hypothetical protein
MTTMTESTTINGIDTDALRGAIEAITQDPAHGMTRWQATTRWAGGTCSETLDKIHRTVMATWPNYFNLANAMPLKSRLVVM